VVGEVGGHRAALSDVARRAGVAKSLLYQHFASKEELLAALIEHHGGRAVARVAGLAPTGSLDGDLRAGIAAVIAYAAEEPAAWRILFVERYQDPAPHSAQMAVMDRARATVAARLRGELGDVPPHAPDLVAQLLRSALDGAISWWHDHPEVSAAELGDITYAMLWHGIQPMIASRPPHDSPDTPRR
jgi:AcrR family transcriptional regulator